VRRDGTGRGVEPVQSQWVGQAVAEMRRGGDVGWTSFFYDLAGERDRRREGKGRLGGAALSAQQGVGP
jgi:hypothetical protein